MKNKIFLILLTIVVCGAGCKKKNRKLHVPTHNGVYIGKFSFNSYPQYDFSDTFVVFRLQNKYLAMSYKNNPYTQLYSELANFSNLNIYIKDYSFIVDSFPQQLVLSKPNYEKYKITAEIEKGLNSSMDVSGTLELTYVSEK